MTNQYTTVDSHSHRLCTWSACMTFSLIANGKNYVEPYAKTCNYIYLEYHHMKYLSNNPEFPQKSFKTFSML